MTNIALDPETIIRAWKDAGFRSQLSDAMQRGLPENPAGEIELGMFTRDMNKMPAITIGNCSVECTVTNCTATQCSMHNCFDADDSWIDIDA